MVRKLGWSLVMAVLLAGTGTVWAQEESVFEGEEREENVHEAGIPIGAFIFSPTLELIYEDKDNIYLSETNKVDDQVYVVRGRLMFELPFAENYFRITYMPQWRDYDEYEFDENWSHFLDFNVRLDTPSGFELKLDNHLVRGVLEVPEVDPGRELVYGDDDNPFLSDRASVIAGYAFTETDFLGATFSYTTVDYDEPCAADSKVCFYDFQTLQGGLNYRRDLNPILRLDFRAGVTTSDTDGTSEFRDSDGWWGKIGVEGELGPRLASTLAVGYENREFDEVAGMTRQKFTGVTVDGTLDYAIGESTSLELELMRGAFLSNFEENAYYEANKIGLALETRLVAGLFGSLGGFLQTNDYDRRTLDVDGFEYREDDIKRAFLGLGYHFNDLFSIRGNFRWEDRDSNITGFSYEARTLLVNLILGY